MKLEYTAITDRGKVRTENQDTICVPGQLLNGDNIEAHAVLDESQPCLFAVLDGMGGALCGKEASTLAAQTLLSHPATTDFGGLCRLMNDEVCRFMAENDVKTMGSTVAIVRLDEKNIEFCNIGDSRIYLIQNYSMYRLSKDHTMTAFGGRRALTQHLGILPKEMLIEPHVGAVAAAAGSTVVLCSDGLTDLLTEPEIGKIILENDCQSAAHALKEEALKRGGKDNVSVIVIRIQ